MRNLGKSTRVLLVSILLYMLETFTNRESFSLDFSKQVSSSTASRLGRCNFTSEFFLRFSELVGPEFCSISGSLPISDLILIVDYEINESTSDGDVSLVPCGILILLQLENLETIEIDGVDSLLLPLLIKHWVSIP